MIPKLSGMNNMMKTPIQTEIMPWEMGNSQKNKPAKVPANRATMRKKAERREAKKQEGEDEASAETEFDPPSAF